MNINVINALVLAYIGDAVYELKVRKYLIDMKLGSVNNLQNKSVDYVSANSQAKILDRLLDMKIFTNEELNTINRAKNHKSVSKPKSASAISYKKATALEALFGMLYLTNRNDRIDEIFRIIVGD